MDNIVVAAKSAQTTSEIAWGNIKLGEPSVVKLPIDPSQIAAASRNGQNLTLTLRSGEKITLGDFFPADPAGDRSELVLEGQDGQLWQGQYNEAAFEGFTFTEVNSLDEVIAASAIGGSATPEFAFMALSLLGVGAGGAAVASAANSGGGGGGGSGDTTAPDAPTDLALSADGLFLSGRGEAGATVTIRDANGNVLGTGTVDADGNFQVGLNAPQTNGQNLGVTLTDGAGNESAPTNITAPVVQEPGEPGEPGAPATPTELALSGDGRVLSGRGTPGNTIEVRDAAGNLIGTAVVGADGNFSLTLDSPQLNGEVLQIVAVNDDGTASAAAQLTASDITPPAAVTDVALGDDGLTLTGRGEPGATVTVKDANGAVIGTGTVGADGSFQITLGTPQLDGQTLQLSQTDPAGNTSATTDYTVADTTAPDAVTDLLISADGLTLTGKGEVGATVTIRDADGNLLGTAVVNANGTFIVTLDPAVSEGAVLSVVQTDAAGNESAVANVTAPDDVGPGTPGNLALSNDGLTLTGTGTAGNTVEVRDANGNVIGTGTVGSDGTFSITLDTSQTNGQFLEVVAIDGNGEESVPVPYYAADSTAPDALTDVAINANGSIVTGKGEAGATVTVRDAQGNVIGTGLVAADGSFSIALATPQADAQQLNLTQADPAGNVSTAVSVTAPDLTSPAALADLAVSANGQTLTGSGEAGATVTVRDAAGTVLATGTVGNDGRFSLTLDPAQINGEALTATQTDPAGNVSPVANVDAPDIQAPAAPSDLALDPTGAVLSGTGEAGSIITVKDAQGNVIGTGTVSADGTFQITLDTPQTAGGVLQVTAADEAGNTSLPVSLDVNDITPPAAVTDLMLSADGLTLTGKGEAGATVTIRDADGNVLGTATVAANGAFIVSLSPAATEGEVLNAVQTDAAGNNSPAATITAPDAIGPGTPGDLSLSSDGATLTGTGTAGNTVEVRGADGNVLGTATVGADGTFTLTLDPAQTNGEFLEVVATDARGEESVPVPLIAGDSTAPAPLDDLAVNATGTIVTGTGEAGATVTVRDASGNVIGTGTVGQDGSFTIGLTTAQINAQNLQLTQADAAGNLSTPASVLAPDLTPPAAVTNLAVAANGLSLTGMGEVGATVTVRGPNGAVLGTGTVGSDGHFSVTLNSPQYNGQALTVSEADAAGNVSPSATVNAADTQAPGAPTGLTMNTTGNVLSGTGEAGATVTVRGADGTVLGTTVVQSNGHFDVPLNAPQTNGQILDVIQTDPGNNVSAPAVFNTLDSTPPAAVSGAVLSLNGTTLTGLGEAGATVTVLGANNALLGTAVVLPDGTFSVTISPAQIDGQTLNITQADAAGNASTAVSLIAGDLTNPAAPDVSLSPDGTTLTGTAEAGATVTVTDSAGNPLGSQTVGSNGNVSITLTPPLTNGETLQVVATDGQGNASLPSTVVAGDSTPPAPVEDLVLAPDGTSISGTAEPGSTVTVNNGTTELGTVTAGPDGTFVVPLDPPAAGTDTLTVVAEDAGGNTSAPVTIAGPTGNEVAPPSNLDVSDDGFSLTGIGTSGSVVTATSADGTVLGSATVGAFGGFRILFSAFQLNGQVLKVVASLGGVSSAVAQVTADDTTAPDAPSNIQVNANGSVMTGQGEAGATITVTSGGTLLGTTTVADNGTFVVALTPTQSGGQNLVVTQTDVNGNPSAPTPATAPDLQAPGVPGNLSLNNVGTVVSGTGEAGATVTIKDAQGNVVGTGTVDQSGSFQVTLTTPQTAGGQLQATQADAAGNVSGAGTVNVADTTPPAAVSDVVINTNGTSLTGKGEAGATVTVTNAAGTVLGTAVVAGNGTFAVTLNPAANDGSNLSINQADVAGNVSPVSTLPTPDLTAPVALTNVAINTSGTVVTGRGEIGATVTVSDAQGTVLGTATVGSNGSFSVTLTPAQTNSQALTVNQADVAGNLSPNAAVIAPDLVAPNAPTDLSLNPNGTTLTGKAEVGSTVTVVNAQGTVVGTGVTAANGTFQVTLTPAQANGQVLSATAADAANNVSGATSLTATDTTAPGAVTGLAVNADGDTVVGTGEAGATVTIRNAADAVIGTGTVDSTGHFSVTISPAAGQGDILSATQADAAGNVSPGASVTAPGDDAPATPNDLVLSADGTTLTGTADVGDLVTVRASDGTVLGTAAVGAGGTFEVTLSPAQTNGQVLDVSASDGVNTSLPGQVTAGDTTPPADLVNVAINVDGTAITGRGEVGATVSVSNANSIVIGTAVVAADGSFSVTLDPAQTNGQALTVTQSDANNNLSDAANVTAPDFITPDAPTGLAVSADGAVLSGQGEAGATVIVTNAGGALVGQGTVAIDGSFQITLDTPQANGELLAVTQTDPAGNVSDPTDIRSVDVTPPAMPTDLVVINDGATVSGKGEVGSIVIVSDAQSGAELARGVVAGDGTFQVTLAPPLTNGEALSVVLQDAAQNLSEAGSVSPTDISPPDPLADVAVSDNGAIVTGTGEPGATVTVKDASGTLLGSSVVLANGDFSVTLTPAQINHQQLSVLQADPPGNLSEPTLVFAPDLDVPDAPSNLQLNTAGDQLTGVGEPGTTVNVTLADGTPLGTAVVGEGGLFQVAVDPPQVNGETLLVTLSDTANTSAVGTVTAGDTTPPDAVVGAINAAGTVVSGTGEANSILTVTNADNVVVGTGQVQADGTFSITLTTPQTNGEALTVIAQDAKGNPSQGLELTAPDITAPGAPVVTSLSADGVTLAGTGEPNAILTAHAANGDVLGTGTVGTDGNFSFDLDVPQANGETFTLTQTDAAGNESAPAQVQADDTTAPVDLTEVAINTAGNIVTGKGEALATVTVYGADDAVLGTTVVAADGTFSVSLNADQLNGEVLRVNQEDTNGNVSNDASVTAFDSTPPDAPQATSITETSVAGTTEALATVIVVNASGVELGRAQADENGDFEVTLAPAQNNGGVLTLYAQDVAQNLSTGATVPAVDTTDPDPVTQLALNADRDILVGRGEAGALVEVRDANAALLGSARVAADGTFSVELDPAATIGESLSITQTDAATNVSDAVDFNVPQQAPPTAPTGLALDGTGLILTGTAQEGTTITVRDASGATIGSGSTGVGGTFQITLDEPQTNGQALQVTATDDDSGLNSLPTAFTAADTTPPADLTDVAINPNGTQVTGRGEAGATVHITNAAGTEVGTGIVTANGTFAITLSPVQNNGGNLTALQTDGANLSSNGQTIVAPDIVAPLAPTNLALSADGLTLTGNGEAGTTVNVVSGGVNIGSVVVGSGGTFTVPLDTAQTNGQALTVTLTDAASNVSPSAPYLAADTTPPAAPTNLALSSNGLVLTGKGEVGATVTVLGPQGASLGTAIVDSNGNFSVTLSAAQLNGQVLTAQQTDAATLTSPSTSYTAADIQAPVAPTATINGTGTTVSGTGEVGATVIVYSGNTVLGSVVVPSGGSYSIGLSPALTNGEVLTVRQVDAATNTSPATSVTAPDTTPPAAATNVAVNASGTTISGAGAAGSTVRVVNAQGQELGTGTVAANGTFTIALSTAQINNEVLTVTLGDTAGNISGGSTAIAPDLTPPPAAANLAVSTDGNSLTGNGEVGATVTVKSAAGVTLGTVVIGAGGGFTVALNASQINGESLRVTLTDAKGNVSPIATVIAADVDANAPVVATDNLATASVIITPVVTTSTSTDSFATLLNVGAFAKVYSFTVASGTTLDSTLTFSTNSVLSLFDGATYALQVKNAAGVWVTIANGSDNGLLDIILLGTGQGATVNLNDLQAGDYRLAVGSSALLGVITQVNLVWDREVTSLTQFTSAAGGTITGNVVDDPGVNGSGADQTGPDDGAVLQILKSGSYVNAGTGTTVQGAYGTLTIAADGSYSYTPNGSLSSVGKVETFQYQLVHPNGLSDTATLYIRIDSPQANEVWNDSSLGSPATLVDATDDVASTSITLANREVTTTTSLGTFSGALLAQQTGTYTTTVAAGTVGDLTVSITASGIVLLNQLTLVVTGPNGFSQTFSGSSLLGLGSNTVSAVLNDRTAGTYTIKVTSGAGALATFTTSVTNVATYNNEFVVNSYTAVTGNLLTDTAGGGVDVLGSELTTLKVLSGGTYVLPGYNGASIVGTYGTLLVQEDGSYSYTLKSGLSNAVIGKEDVFTYELVHPNGATDTATLTIDLNQASALARTSLVDDSAVASASETHYVIGTDGNDTLDGSTGGALTLQGGAGDDHIVVYDQAFTAVDGGTGTDTLVWGGGDANIDLSNLADRISNIEVIDLNNTSAVNLTISLDDLLQITDNSTLLIKGDNHDTVHMTGNWTAGSVQVADGVQYIPYTPQEDESHHLWVQNSISVV